MEPATAVATGTRLHRDHLRSAQDTAQEPAKAAGQEGPVREASSPGTGECVLTRLPPPTAPGLPCLVLPAGVTSRCSQASHTVASEELGAQSDSSVVPLRRGTPVIPVGNGKG